MNFTQIKFALFDVYKFPRGYYTNKYICDKLKIGNPYERKTINDKECFLITENDLITIETTTFYKAKIIPIIEMNISAKFTVYVDENDDNKLYVEKTLCHRYKITNQIERSINGKKYYQVSPEEIDQIEKLSKDKKLSLKRKYEVIRLDKEKLHFNYFRTKDTLYVTRDLYELSQKNQVKIEGNPKIINNCNCYSIKEEELVELERKTNSKGKRIIIKEPKTIDTYIVYKDMDTNKIYIPKEYIPTQSRAVTEIMNKECFESSERELEKMFNKKFIIVDVYLKNKNKKLKEILNITVCYTEDKLFISQEIIDSLNFQTSLRKKIRINGNIFHQITQEELQKIKIESSKNYLINITKKHIVKN